MERKARWIWCSGVSWIAGAAKSPMNCVRNLYCWIALVALLAAFGLPVLAQAQTGAVSVRGTVSEVVAISASPNLAVSIAMINNASDRRSLTLELTGSGAEVQTVRLPILIRSNSSYSISSLVRSESVASVILAPIDARATGRFVASDAAANVVSTNPGGSTRLDLSAPTSIFRGSRVSLAGTLDSPENAVEVTLLVTVRPEAKTDGWRLHLTLSAAPGPGGH